MQFPSCVLFVVLMTYMRIFYYFYCVFLCFCIVDVVLPCYFSYFSALVLCFSQYLISSFKLTVDEIMANVQHQFYEVKIDFKTRNLKRRILTSQSHF